MLYNPIHAAIKDLRFVVKALKTLSSRWEEIGMTADVKDLDKIKKEHRGTCTCSYYEFVVA